ncbi:hypothetical protein KFK09_021533 [Dendrobium nobile]|uniref:Membrane insertase YidC/Oxa/ALB C-terminal domain-containing protein n=1 Tax=Dendrobium nobile TaxID=94219 RepID=A0A8T3ARE6_DENNO|nr:hypothetical protein KFK09_021533 [Dendrobium nobile]
MAKSLAICPAYFLATPLHLHLRLGRQGFPLSRPQRAVARVRMSLGEFPQPNGFDSLFDLGGITSRMEGLLFTLADAVVAADPSTSETTAAAAAQKNGGWFGFISDAMEVVLKVLKDGLSAVHVPYAYGFAIILLTVIVKAATFPLTKKQVESTLAMQNLQPKIKAIQERYAGNQERIQLETARLYKQAGVNPLAGCFPTLATIPVWIGLYQALSNVANEDGHPPLGWSDTAAYLVLPVLLIVSQYVSMEIMKPPETDPSSKNTLLVFKFLPLMIGYFSLSVPSGLSIYWLTNNILSTAQQLWLRKLGGAKPIVSPDAGDIISAGQAKRSGRSGERFKQLKEEEESRKMYKASQREEDQILASDSESDELTDGESKNGAHDESYAATTTGSKGLPNYTGPRKGKRSKRKRTVQ